MNVTEIFLIAMAIILALPYLIWRLLRTDYYAPLVVIQVLTGVALGPGALGAIYPDYYAAIFNPPVISALNGLAWWGVMVFVMIAGIELDLKAMWRYKRESAITASAALGAPLLCGALAALFLLSLGNEWMGAGTQRWQFLAGVGIACAVTALPVLIMLLDKLEILRQPVGQRVMRYGSLDDLIIWAVLALILLDWERVGRQALFLLCFGVASALFRRLMVRLGDMDRWYVAIIWLAVCAYGADWCGLHYIVGAFLAGVVMEASWFRSHDLDLLRRFVLLLAMPVYFLSTGLRTSWSVGSSTVFLAAAVLTLASVGGKLAGVHLAGRVLKWGPGEASVIGWLLQTKGLVMIVFANVLLDKGIIASPTFTALLMMAVVSTMLTVPMVAPRLRADKELIMRAC